VLAGDIGVGTAGVDWAATEFPDVPVIYVPGNHEYYDHDIGITDQLKSGAPANVHVLERDALEIDGVRFLGTTLWTDFRFYGEGRARSSRQQARDHIQDFKSIRNGEQPFTPEDSVLLHDKSRSWLVKELRRQFDGPTVVVTHHLPASPSVASPYRNHPLNPVFVSRLEDIIEQHTPGLWIHGHTHVACDYDIYGTRVVCNPRGYPAESAARGFSPDRVVEV